jgi:hypothetical protein
MATVYFAPVSSSGTGAWTQTKSLGDQPEDEYNENDFFYIADCADFLVEVAGGTFGDWFSYLIGVPYTCTTTTSQISTTLSSPSINATQSFFDTATLSGVTANAGGSVSYIYYAGSSCSGPSANISKVTVTNGVVPPSSPVTENLAGPESLRAYYSGDANNPPAMSACELLNVGKASPKITTQILNSVDQNTSTAGISNTIYDSAKLTGQTPQAGGTVTYYVYNDSSCGGSSTQLGVPVTVINGLVIESRPTSFSAAGSYSFQAVYSGDGSDNGATSPCEPMTISAPPQTSVESTTENSTAAPPPTSAVTIENSTTIHENSTSASSTPNGDTFENLFEWNEKYSGFLVYIPDYFYGGVVVIGLGVYYYRKRIFGAYSSEGDYGKPTFGPAPPDAPPDEPSPPTPPPDTPSTSNLSTESTAYQLPPPPPPRPPQSSIPAGDIGSEPDGLTVLWDFMTGRWNWADQGTTVRMEIDTQLHDTINGLPANESSTPKGPTQPTEQVM